MLNDAQNVMQFDQIGNSPQHYMFLAYHAAMKDFIKSVVYLERFPKNDNVKSYWSTPSRAWAKYVQPIINGGPSTPVITFHLNNAEPNTRETMGGWPFEIEEIDGKTYMTHTPSIWSLKYTVTIWTSTIVDMEKILYQLFLFTMPPKLWAGKIDKKVWYEIKLDGGIGFEDELEPGATKDKLIRRSLTFTIPRAYIPRESIEVYTINEVSVSMAIEDVLNSKGDEIIGEEVPFGNVN